VHPGPRSARRAERGHKLAGLGVLAPLQVVREKLLIHRALLDLLVSNTHEVPTCWRNPNRQLDRFVSN
jgi:hypothetical protein